MLPTSREREAQTLNFKKPVDRGAVEETFFPWTLTKERFAAEGMPPQLAQGVIDATEPVPRTGERELYFPVTWGEGVLEYERWLGFDAVRRMHFVLPFRRFTQAVPEDTPESTLRQDMYGRHLRRDKSTGLETEVKHPVESMRDWEQLAAQARAVLETQYTQEAITAAYAPLRAGHERGDYALRLNLEGFFWVPRELMGIEPHLYNFYDAPELIHAINKFVLEIYETYLMRVLAVVVPDVVYFMEDLSGKNGPMISAQMFDEFVGAYYEKLFPRLREKGVGNIFVDTDGDFNALIPHFLKAGVDGFLPMDVNAGMDIVQVRRQYPRLKFIGGFNKLCIAQGKEAIDAEFARILPVIRGGGYIVGADHQVAPSVSLQNYQYYIERLTQAMEQAGLDLPGASAATNPQEE